MSERGYVVTRPFADSGLGSNLASMAGALWLARQLDRELVVDWRGLVFLQDQTLNYFTQYFAQLPEIDGVRVHYAPSEEVGDYASAPEAEIRQVDRQFGALTSSESATLPRYVVLTTYHGLDRLPSGDAAADHFYLRRFYQALALRPDVQAKLEAFYDEQLAGAFVVGLNLATGNVPPSSISHPEYGRFDSEIFGDSERFLGRVRRAIRLATWRLPRELRETARVFCATDSRWMSDLLSDLPGARRRRTVFPPSGVGRSYSEYEQLGYSDLLASEDMVIDHFLLGRCDAQVYNGSMFGHYSRVVTNYFSGNCSNIESMYAKYWIAAVRQRARRALRH